MATSSIMRLMHASSQLLPLLRSPFQDELLAWLFLHPDDEYSATDLAGRFHVSQPTASREADRLAQAGLINERRTGNLRLLRAKIDTVVARPLTDLLAVTYGPLAIVGELLSRIPGVDEAHLYGSWAARHHGEPGPIPATLTCLSSETRTRTTCTTGSRSRTTPWTRGQHPPRHT
jgi:DNA-binding transcriptional ArsR family regulator